jgi:hypothetical protein
VDGALAAGADELEAEVLIKDAVVKHHAHEAAGDEGGFDRAEGAAGDLLFDEVGDDAVDHLTLALEKVLGELMLFEGTEEDEPEVVGMFGLELDNEIGQPGEEGFGVVAGGEAFLVLKCS